MRAVCGARLLLSSASRAERARRRPVLARGRADGTAESVTVGPRSGIVSVMRLPNFVRALVPALALSGTLVLDAGFGCESPMPFERRDAGRHDSGVDAGEDAGSDAGSDGGEDAGGDDAGGDDAGGAAIDDAGFDASIACVDVTRAPHV